MNTIQDLITNLPATRDQVDWKNRKSVNFPSVNGEDSTTSLFSKSDVKEWYDKFEKIYGEKPKLFLNKDKVDVINLKFKMQQEKYKSGKSDFLKGLKHTDENKIPTMKKSEAAKFIKEQILSSLSEKKKGKKDEEVEDITADNEEISSEETPETSTGGIDPNVKALQTHLNKAVEAAQALGDQKLITQLGNTITYFTRAHVSKTETN